MANPFAKHRIRVSPRSLVLGVIALAASLLFPASAEAQQYSFNFYGVDQGLNNLAVKRLFQDKRGFLWVSTEDGIFRYDGERFQSFGIKEGIPPSAGVAFGEAPDGGLLIGGSIGLFRMTGERFEQVSMPGAQSVSWFSGIQSDGHGTTWISTDAGLFAVTGGHAGSGFQFRLVPQAAGVEKPNAYGLLVKNGIITYGCDKQVCQLKAGTVTAFNAKDGLPSSTWKSFQLANNGDLWAQGRSEVAVLRRGATRFEITHSPFLSDGATGVLGSDSAGRVIFGTSAGLVIREGDRWESVGRSSGLRGTPYCTLQDREGFLWIGLLGRGLVRWTGYKEWEAFTSDSGLGNDIVYQVLPLPDGTVWAGTEGGLFRGQRVDQGWTWRKQPQLGSVSIHSIRPDKAGSLWLGTESKGAARFNPATGQVEWFGEKQGLVAKSPYILTLDGQNRIWAATERGLFVADLLELRFRLVDQVPAIQIWAAIEAPNGEIWAGSVKGVFRLAGRTWSHITTNDGLSHEVVLSLAAAKNGDIWVGYRYGGGIDRIHMRDGRLEIAPAGLDPGKRPTTVYFLGFDTRERLWAGTDRGVDVWDGKDWNHIDRHDGLVWDDCDLNGFAAGPDGAIWIGTSAGLARFKPQPVARLIYPPDVILTGVVLGKKEVDPATSPVVDHRSNMLHLRFSALTFTRENSVVFRYRMAPLFDQWRETQQREIQFDGLVPDTYRLEVLARDGWGNWGAQPASFSFQILQPWWRKPWFICIILMIPLAVVALFGRLRISAMRRREHHLVRLVEDRTTELRQANDHLLRLSSMDGLTDVANRRMFDQTLNREWNHMLRTGAPLSLVLMDIDHFKLLNDSLGHQRGDECLTLLASELRRLVKRDTDLVARYGGEEFALILPATDRQGALELAESIRVGIAGLGMAHPTSPIDSHVTVSLGVATATAGRFQTAVELIAAADEALYTAKHRGRDQVACFNPSQDLKHTFAVLARSDERS